MQQIKNIYSMQNIHSKYPGGVVDQGSVFNSGANNSLMEIGANNTAN